MAEFAVLFRPTFFEHRRVQEILISPHHEHALRQSSS
jgi:hypothetical protein